MARRAVAGHGAPACRADGRALHHDPLSPVPDWLRPRLADAPDTLRHIVERDAAGADSAQKPPDALADATVIALRTLLQRNDHSRAIANDLLAVDALITYACEAAVEQWRDTPRGDRADLEQWCGALAARVAALAER